MHEHNRTIMTESVFAYLDMNDDISADKTPRQLGEFKVSYLCVTVIIRRVADGKVIVRLNNFEMISSRRSSQRKQPSILLHAKYSTVT